MWSWSGGCVILWGGVGVIGLGLGVIFGWMIGVVFVVGGELMVMFV